MPISIPDRVNIRAKNSLWVKRDITNSKGPVHPEDITLNVYASKSGLGGLCH